MARSCSRGGTTITTMTQQVDFKHQHSTIIEEEPSPERKPRVADPMARILDQKERVAEKEAKENDYNAKLLDVILMPDYNENSFAHGS